MTDFPVTKMANRGEKNAPRTCGASVLGQTLGERSTLLITRPASRCVDLCQCAGRAAIFFVVAAAIVAAAGCDTVRFKAAGSEKKVDWGVGVRF